MDLTIKENMIRWWKNSSKLKIGLLAASGFLTVFFIFFSGIGLLPFRNPGDFFFVAVMTLAFSLYRPGWAFLFLVSSIMLENIDLSPESFPIDVRPYQLLSLGILIAIAIRYFSRKLNFRLPKLRWFDFLPIILAASGSLSALSAQDKLLALKLSAVLLSFLLVYFLSRTFVRDITDLERILPFFLVSSLLAVFYGIWQNWRFTHGLSSLEVMPGRPNSVFSEPDWLGGFLVLLLSALLSLAYRSRKREAETYQEIVSDGSRSLKEIAVWISIFLTFVLLIITVSRSAWLGALASGGIFLASALIIPKRESGSFGWKALGRSSCLLLGSFLLAVLAVWSLHLTDFQLKDRLSSTTSGKERITLSCADGRPLPEMIASLEELERYSCRHIDLEDIETEKAAGRSVREIEREDPNFDIRGNIYAEVRKEIQDHPVLGIGWGNIGNVLGTDSSGNSLNASNLFFEIYLGSGAVGLLSFLAFWIYLPIRSLRKIFSPLADDEISFQIFILSAWLGLSVFNLFNSGIFLGFLWLFLAIGVIGKTKKI